MSRPKKNFHAWNDRRLSINVGFKNDVIDIAPLCSSNALDSFKFISYNVHSLVFSVQSPVPRVQRPEFRVQCPESNDQDPASSIQRPESNVHSLASRVQRPDSSDSVQRPESSVQSPTSKTCVQSPEIPPSTTKKKESMHCFSVFLYNILKKSGLI